MKKIIAVLLSMMLLLSLCAGTVAVNAEEDYVEVNTYSAALSVPAERIGPSSDRVPNQGAYFNAASAFNKISIPRYWSSNPANSGRGDITVRFDVFKFDTDYATSIAGTALYSKQFTTDKDQNAPLEFDLGKNYEKGSYAISFSVVSEDDGLTRYFVLPETNCTYSELRIGFSSITFGFSVNFVKDSSLDKYFARLPGTEELEEIEEIIFADNQDAGARKVNDAPLGVRFTVPAGKELVSLTALRSPTWTEKENNDMKVELYAWNTDYDTTVAGNVLAGAEVVGDVDNADAVFALNNRVAAGEVLALFTATNTGSVGFYGANFSNYITEAFAGGESVGFYPRISAKYASKGDSQQPVTPVVTYSTLQIGEGAAIGTWVKGTENTASVAFTTAGGLKGIALGIYWASRAQGENPTGPEATWTAELFEYKTDAETTFSQSPLKSTTVTSVADNNPVFKMEFDEAFPAGTYVVRFTVTNADFVDDNGKSPYLVLPLPDIRTPDSSKFAFSGEAFNLAVIGETMDNYFVANPANVSLKAPEQPVTGEPEPQPQTGDVSVTMIAVFAVLALGAAVVVAKKRAY